MKTFSITDIGRQRDTNQDDVFTSEIPVGNLPNLFLVADGMGGHAAGDYASGLAVEKIKEYVGRAEEREPVAVLKMAIEEANRMLFEEANADPAKEGMGTTIVAAVIQGDCLYTANIGDSRLYVINQEGITQITRDHSLVEEMVRMGEMDKSEAKSHPDKNIITRAVGILPEISADFFETRLCEGDIILLCTDGLTNMVEDEQIRRIVLGKRDLVEQAEKLVEAANENGGRDNITVVLIGPYGG